MTRVLAVLAAALGAALLGSARLPAQTLAQRIARAPDGSVHHVWETAPEKW